MPNQLMPVSRTVAPVLSMILLPLVWRYPVPVPPVAADAGEAARTAAVSTPAAAVATAAMPPARAGVRNTVTSFELQRDGDGRERGQGGDAAGTAEWEGTGTDGRRRSAKGRVRT